MELPELMTVRDFLDAFRVGKTTFYKEVASGRLHTVKVGKSTKIARVDAEAWLNRLRKCPSGGVAYTARESARNPPL